MSRACPTDQVRLGQSVWREEKNEIYREGTGNGVKAHMYLMDKVGGITDTHQRATRVDVILPAV